MGTEFKFGKNRGTAREGVAKLPSRRGRSAAAAADAWERMPLFPDESDDEIDYLRMVQAGGGRSLPLYDDDNDN